mgnify:CR=1 FL=1
MQQAIAREEEFNSQREQYYKTKYKRQEKQIPNWFDKEQEIQLISKEEQEEMENMIGGISNGS